MKRKAHCHTASAFEAGGSGRRLELAGPRSRGKGGLSLCRIGALTASPF